MLEPSSKRDLKKSYKRLMIFLAIIFVFDGFIAFLFIKYTNMHPVLCGFLIIVITTFFYLIFLAICAKIDQRKKKRISESGKKDPFSKN